MDQTGSHVKHEHNLFIKRISRVDSNEKYRAQFCWVKVNLWNNFFSLRTLLYLLFSLAPLENIDGSATECHLSFQV